jgi:outer membrane receptor protein involved in Fe transport
VIVGSADFNHFDYRVGEQFDLRPNAMQYLTISSGYKPGQLGYLSNTNSWDHTPDEVNNAAELGVKSRWLDNRLQINGDAFLYDMTNYQLKQNYVPYLPVGTGGITQTYGGSSNICYVPHGVSEPVQCNLPLWDPNLLAYGVETQIKFNLTADDRFSFNGTFERSFFHKGTTCATIGYTGTLPASACPFGGNTDRGFSQGGLYFIDLTAVTPPHTPEWGGTISYDHSFHFRNYVLAVGGQAFYSDWYLAFPQQPGQGGSTTGGYDEAIQPAYWLGNLTASVRPEQNGWSVNAFIRNLTNYAVKQTSNGQATQLGDPRTYGATLNYKW